jgi:hypothetical protein
MASDGENQRIAKLETMDKKLSEYQATQSRDLALFQVADYVNTRSPKNGEELKPSHYSNSIEFYDFIPKFVYKKVKREDNTILPIIAREFEHRNTQWTVKINPAYLEAKEGVVRGFYPTRREQFVLDALIKLACHDGYGVELDGRFSVRFKMSDLYKELAAHGHTYSYDQIKESLNVMRSTKLDLACWTGGKWRVEYSINMFDAIGVVSRGNETDGDTFCYVRFNEIIEKCVKDKTYRLVNYAQSMEYVSVIAQHLHKRLSHHFTQAHVEENFTMHVSRMIRDFGLTESIQFRENIQQVKEALEEMRKANVVEKYRIEIVYGYKEKDREGKLITKQKTKPHVVDAKVSIWVTDGFTEEVKIANAVNHRIRNKNPILKRDYPHHEQLSLLFQW